MGIAERQNVGKSLNFKRNITVSTPSRVLHNIILLRGNLFMFCYKLKE